jgi:phosphocarrier protein HPr
MMGVLMLGAGKGTTLRLMIEGDDDALAHQAIVDLFNRRFDEGENKLNKFVISRS